MVIGVSSFGWLIIHLVGAGKSKIENIGMHFKFFYKHILISWWDKILLFKCKIVNCNASQIYVKPGSRSDLLVSLV